MTWIYQPGIDYCRAEIQRSWQQAQPVSAAPSVRDEFMWMVSPASLNGSDAVPLGRCYRRRTLVATSGLHTHQQDLQPFVGIKPRA